MIISRFLHTYPCRSSPIKQNYVCLLLFRKYSPQSKINQLLQSLQQQKWPQQLFHRYFPNFLLFKNQSLLLNTSIQNMGCGNSISVAEQPHEKSQNPKCKSFKSNFSIKSKCSINSNFSRKRNKRSKKSNKITLTPQQRSNQDNKQNIQINNKPKITNVKIRQIHKKLQIQDIIELNNILNQHFFFFKLKKQQRVSLIEELKLFEVKKGKYVYEKFDKPNRLYFVKEGLLEIQTENQSLPTRFLHKSDSFGQIDLVVDLERPHTIIARQNCKLWGLQKWKIEQIKESLINQHSAVTMTYLQKVSTFSYLLVEQIEKISKKMFTFKFRANQTIFLKGDPSTNLYIIISGQVELQIPNKNSLILKAGQVFGQGCLKANPMPRIGTATSYNQSKCLVISRSDFTKSLGGNHIQNIMHFSILKWAFKRSFEFKDESSSTLYKKIQKGKIQLFKDKQNIFQNVQNYMNFYFVSLEERVNHYGVGTLVNCTINNNQPQYIKQGDGHVFILEIKKPKLLGKSLKMVKFEQKKQCDLRIPLNHVYRQEDFKCQDLQKFLQNLILIKKIKSLEGGKGDLFNVLNKSDGKFYNIRCTRKVDVSEKKNVQNIINEKEIMIKAKQNSFLSLLYKTFHDDHHIFYVSKSYVNGSLQMLLEKHKSFTPQITTHLIACMIVGLQYMHMKMGAVHRNLSLQSVFLDEEGYFCIDNFENAKRLEPNDPRTHTIVGTPQYFAPEMIDGKGYSFEVDFWALGVMIYRVIYGKFPFTNMTKDPFDIFKHIIKNNVEFKITTKCSPALVQLTRQLLSSNPKSRINQNGIIHHQLLMMVDWDQLQQKKAIPPFNIEMFAMKRIDKRSYEEGKSYFSNYISKERRKIQENLSTPLTNFKAWDSNFD